MNARESFTPGPWSFNDDDGLAPWSYALNIMAADGSWLASTTRGFEGNGEDSNSAAYANAHLIVAAPELYKTLESILAEDNPNLIELSNRLEAGRAALRKARGEPA